MNNKVAELFAIMIKYKDAPEFFQNGWNALYNDLMADPIKAVKQGENDGWLNKVSAMALLDWYEEKERV